METVKKSSKFDDIGCKILISSGSPSVYQLTPEYKKIGTIKKYVLGERNANKPNKTVLLVGETGVGKSTLINALVNYAIGVKWEDNVYFDIVGDEDKDQSVSLTDDVIVYQIFGFKEETLPYSLTIIDTPGYGNTGGPEHDAVVHQRLFDLFSSQDGIHEINAVGLVMKSTECRLSDRLSYIFDSVTSLLGKYVKNNVVALMTYSNGRRPEDALNTLKAAKIRYATDEKNQPVYFLFDNCLKKNRSKNVEFLKNSDEISRKGLEGFAELLGQTPPLKLEQTLEVMNDRIILTACINSLQDKVRFLELKRQEREQIQEALKKKTLEDVKKKYQESEKAKEEKSSLLDHLENEIKSLDNKITKLLEESFQHVRHLDQIALNACSVSTLVKLDFLIEKLKERNDQGKVEELTRIKQRMIQKGKGWGSFVTRIWNYLKKT